MLSILPYRNRLLKFMQKCFDLVQLRLPFRYAFTCFQQVKEDDFCISSSMFFHQKLPYLNADLISDFFIFILSSRESGGGAVRRANPDSLRSCLCFQVFPVEFSSDFFNLLLARFHQAEIIIVKHLILRNSETWLGVEPLTFRSWSS